MLRMLALPWELGSDPRRLVVQDVRAEQRAATARIEAIERDMQHPANNPLHPRHLQAMEEKLATGSCPSSSAPVAWPTSCCASQAP